MGRRRGDVVRQHRRCRPGLRGRSVSRNADRGSGEVHRRGSFLLHRRTVGLPARRSESAMTWNLASGLEGKRVLVTGGVAGSGGKWRWPLPRRAPGSRWSIYLKTRSRRWSRRWRAARIWHWCRRSAPSLRSPETGRDRRQHDRRPRRPGLRGGRPRAPPKRDEVSEADWDFQHDINLKRFSSTRPASRCRATGTRRRSSTSPRAGMAWSGRLRRLQFTPPAMAKVV